MFKRLRTLRISLAAKCQLLFGAAVVLIIGAALSVPWQRMEQLTEQLNERSARTLIDYAVQDHLNDARKAASATQPFDSDAAVAIPATQPTSEDSDKGLPPRLILSASGVDESDLTTFERRCVRRLIDHPDREAIPQLY